MNRIMGMYTYTALMYTLSQRREVLMRKPEELFELTYNTQAGSSIKPQIPSESNVHVVFEMIDPEILHR